MSHTPPETRASLLVRLKDRTDADAWSTFVEIYRPVIVRLACRKGLQLADAEDLAQQALSAISQSIQRWETDPRRARFRTWLHKVASNLICNALSRRKPDRANGGSGAGLWMQQQPMVDGPDSDMLRLEYRREVFRWAAARIRLEFQPDSWLAFWLTAVEGQPVDQVATRLGKTRAAVHTARSRIMRRLKEQVSELDINGDPHSDDSQ